MSGTVWIGLCLLLSVLLLELVAPKRLSEGFQALNMKSGPSNPIVNLITRRSDVGIGMEQGVIQDRRYFAGYADVQRYGVKNDFCRMVTTGPKEELMFACALAGTKGTSTGFSTKTVKNGFQVSRDDYMRDIIGDGRDAYCRILKQVNKTHQPMCLRAIDAGFADKNELDTDPPVEIVTLLDFFGGCELWLRFYDDMVDYNNVAVLQYAGSLAINQSPRPTITQGLYFNGKDQFVRFGDTKELSLGNVVKMRTIRAFSVWVKFESFTNNAHIFDFGDGAGRNNTFLGILGKGDAAEGNEVREPSDCPETTVPTGKSGAQFCPEIRPEELLATTSANVDKFVCTSQEVFPNKTEPIQNKPVKPVGKATLATLQYEVWDKTLRKMQIKVNKAIPLGKWTHIAVTAKGMDAMRPDINIYVNGNMVGMQLSGFLPQAKLTTNNYLGKSNWANDFSGYELRDELFNGHMFDFRMYSAALPESKINRIVEWGVEKLGIRP